MNNSIEDKGLERLKKISPNYKEEQWFNTQVDSLNDIFDLKFYRMSNSYTETGFDLSKIIGTDHANYSDITWTEMLGSLIRYNINFGAGYNHAIKVITSTKSTSSQFVDQIVLHKYDHHYYIIDGNHRVCMAKFLGITYFTALVYEHKFDHEYKRQYEIFLERNIAPGDRTNTWNFSLIDCNNKQTKTNIELDIKLFDVFIKLYDEIKQPIISLYKYQRNDSTIHIKSESDLKNKQLISLIRYHKKENSN